MDLDSRTTKSIPPDKSMPIAIIGMSCRFPDEATNPNKLWDMLIEKRSALKEIPRDRFNVDAFYHPDRDRGGTMNNRGGYFLKQDISAFDASFFSISPTEAMAMDPQQRLLLELVYEATESAGIPIADLSETDTSCFVGCLNVDYKEMQHKDDELLPKYHASGTGRAMMSNRLSFFFDLKGPSVTLDTACSTGLVGVHLACQSLRTGESKMAIVAASNVILDPGTYITGSRMQFFSPDSTCFAFDERANGYARGEGVAALILKPLDEALNNNDSIRAIIRGSGVNCDGKTAGITFPSQQAQAALIRKTYEQAGCNLSSTGYFEAHGTGTLAGDTVETSAIGEVFALHRPEGEGRDLYIGSVKTNIGHLEGASGLAGLIKAALSVEKGVIPPNLWFHKPNPAIDFDNWNIYVPTDITPWPVSGIRRASVNSFGYGGTNAHLIIDGTYHYLQQRGIPMSMTPLALPSATTDLKATLSLKHRIFYFSANDVNSLKRLTDLYAEHIDHRDVHDENSFLDNLSYTLCTRRSTLRYGVAVIANSRKDLISKLRETLLPTMRGTDIPKLAFIFTGQGAQWWAMGRELLDHPLFYATLALCDGIMKDLGVTWSIFDELRKSPDDSHMDDVAISQPLCTAIQIALLHLFDSWNIRPVRVAGHSSGEIAAAYVIGAISCETAMKLAHYRGILASTAKRVSVSSGMLAAGLSEQEALSEISALGDEFGKVGLGCINSRRNVTFSGDLTAILELQKRLISRGLFCRKLQVDMGYHSHHMSSIAMEYRDRLAKMEIIPPERRNDVEMFSSVTGKRITPDDLGIEYWVESIVGCVRFSAAIEELCASAKGAEPVSMLIELGPHSALAGPLKQILEDIPERNGKRIKYRSALIRGKDAQYSVLDVAADLLVQGCPVNCSATLMFDAGKPQLSLLTDLPSYCWSHDQKYWSESRLSRDYRLRPFGRSDVLGAPVADWNPAEPRWRNFLRPSEQPWLKGHVIHGSMIFPASGYCCMAMEAMHQLKVIKEGTFLASICTIRDISMMNALVVPDTEDGIEIIFSLRPEPISSINSSTHWNEFRIFSYTKDGECQEHCRGKVSMNKVSLTDAWLYDPKRSAENIDPGDLKNLDVGEFYRVLNTSGMGYGPDFQGFDAISADKGVAIVKLSNSRKAMPDKFHLDRLMHPVTMDSIFQAAIAGASNGDVRNLDQTAVPVFIKEVSVASDLTAPIGRKFTAFAETRRLGLRECTANIVAYDDHRNSPVVRVSDFKCTILHDPTRTYQDRTSSKVRKLCVDAVWKPDVELLSEWDLASALQRPLNSQLGLLHDLEFLGRCLVQKSLEEINPQEIGTMFPHHQHFLQYLHHLKGAGPTETQGAQPSEWPILDDPGTAAKFEHLLSSTAVEANMLVRLGQSIPQILRGEVDALDLMTQGDLLKTYKTSNNVSCILDNQVARYVEMLSHKYPNLDYLEVGAWVGGITIPVLQASSDSNGIGEPKFGSYTCTNRDTSFLQQAAPKFRCWFKNILIKELNIEENIEGQGYGESLFDVIIVGNVVGAFANTSHALSNMRKLLRPGGTLIMGEQSGFSLNQVVIFGGLPEWWKDVDRPNPDGSRTKDLWKKLLNIHQFNYRCTSPDSGSDLGTNGRLIIAHATMDKRLRAKKRKIVVIRPSEPMSDTTAVINSLTKYWRTCEFQIKVLPISILDEKDTTDAICVSFVEFDQDWLRSISPDEFGILKGLVYKAAGMFWITRGVFSNSPRPERAIFLGLARCLHIERGHWPCITVDFDDEIRLDPANVAQTILKVFDSSFTGDSTDMVVDYEFSEKQGVLHIKRAVENCELNRIIAARTQGIALPARAQDLSSLNTHLKVQLREHSSFDSVVWKEFATTALPDDHIEIEVTALGLDAQDLHTIDGHVEDGSIGHGCAGVVTKVGGSVSQFQVGDRVAALYLGPLATYIRIPAGFATRIAEGVAFVSAAAVAMPKTVASYCLDGLARLQHGEKILIHQTTGRVGHEAIRLAKVIGADIFITVDTEGQKRRIMKDYEIDVSRVFQISDISLPSVIQAASAGGVDVFLNSQSGEGLQGRWNCLAPFGRFVNINKYGAAGNGRLDMLPTAKNVTFYSVDIPSIMRHKPVSIQETFQKVMQSSMSLNEMRTSETVVYPISKTGEAFRGLKAEENEGNIVLELKKVNMIMVEPMIPKPTKLSSTASYLLAGGLGGLGRSVSRWMVRHGARNFIFVSRSAGESIEANLLLEELEAAEIKYELIKCDITDTTVFSASLVKALKRMPPIRGVVQAAMVLKDQAFANMTYQNFIAAISPKVQGSWSLHLATLSQPLDFFVVLSSLSGFLGNPGQANYAAGCAYQTALAAHRRGLGLPGTSIDLGRVAEVGYVAEQGVGSHIDNHLKKITSFQITEDEFLAIFELAMPSGEIRNGHIISDPHLGEKTNSFTHLPVLSHLVRGSTRGDRYRTRKASDACSLWNLLSSTTDRDRRCGLMLEALCRKLARVLRMGIEDIDPAKPTDAYGIDSLVMAELRNWFHREARVDLAVIGILRAESLESLAMEAVLKIEEVG